MLHIVPQPHPRTGARTATITATTALTIPGSFRGKSAGYYADPRWESMRFRVGRIRGRHSICSLSFRRSFWPRTWEDRTMDEQKRDKAKVDPLSGAEEKAPPTPLQTVPP